MGVAVSVEGVSKRFRLLDQRYTSLKERVIHMGKVPAHDLWALADVSFAIEGGTTVGLLGLNGSGKSTLLKCIAGILRPTGGRVVVKGRLAAMLELGAGFHPELSGRENVFLNASLLGLSRRDVERRFDEIVAFSEIGQIIDNQVKHYSSGQYARLGFAVAVSVEPDILLVDEVLAVGDEAFQRKCMDRVHQFQAEGRTIVIVTHQVDQVRQNCDRAFVLAGGKLVADGPPGEAIRVFREGMIGPEEVESAGAGDVAVEVPGVVPSGPVAPGSAGRVRITGVKIRHPHDRERPYLLPNEPLTVTVHYEAAEPVKDAVVAIAIFDGRGELVHRMDSEGLGGDLGGDLALDGAGTVELRIAAVPLLDGTYEVGVGFTRGSGAEMLAWREGQDRFEVMNPTKSSGAVALDITVASRDGGGP